MFRLYGHRVHIWQVLIYIQIKYNVLVKRILEDHFYVNLPNYLEKSQENLNIPLKINYNGYKNLTHNLILLYDIFQMIIHHRDS